MSRPSTSSTLYSQRSDLSQVLEKYHVQLEGENEISWDSQSPQHPRNWSFVNKTIVSATVIWLEFFMTAISSAGTAAADSASKEYGISTTLAYFAFITLYLLGQTIGGIFCSPISEVFGRRTIYGLGTGLFAIGSIVTGAPHSVVSVYIGRFVQGVAASIPATVAFGSFNDMFDAHMRVWIVYSYTVFGMAGLALGPIYSVYVTRNIGWRWVFHISTIVSVVSLVPCVFMKESNAEQILEQKVARIRKATGQESLTAKDSENSGFSLKEFLQQSLFRPLFMLATEPLVFFCAALCGIAFGLVYGLTESLSIVYTAPPFGFSDTRASLAFIAILIGEILDVLPRIYDDHKLKAHRRQKRRILPETKVTSFAIACPALAVGLWIFAWTIPPHITSVPWPISMIGLVLVGFALNDFSYVLFGYMSDSYGPYAASAAGAVSMTRGVMGAVFPLFTTQMYKGLGNNVATTILAAAATVFCFTPWLFLRWGAWLRRRSKMASGDHECLKDENWYLDHEYRDRDGDQDQEGGVGGGQGRGDGDGEMKQKQ